MFEGINFVLKQLRKIKKALAQPELAGFAPDGKTAENVVGMLSGVGSTKGNVLALDMAYRGALGAQEVAAADTHPKCVSAYGAMR